MQQVLCCEILSVIVLGDDSTHCTTDKDRQKYMANTEVTAFLPERLGMRDDITMTLINPKYWMVKFFAAGPVRSLHSEGSGL